MNTEVMNAIDNDQMKKRPEVQIGDTVKLHMKIKEGDKERVQIFEGIVIAMKGSGMNKTLTVRKISMGVGVERIVPLHSPTLEKIEVVKRGKVRRSKLYYMRKRVGKLAMKITGSDDMYETDEVEVPETEAEEGAEAKSEVETDKNSVEGEGKMTEEAVDDGDSKVEEKKEEVKSEAKKEKPAAEDKKEEKPVKEEKPSEKKEEKAE